MIRGRNVLLRSIRADELDIVYELITDVNHKGPYWHLNLPSEQEFRKEYAENGCWGKEEGRMLICTPEGDYAGELLYFKGFDYQSGVEVGYEIFHPKHYGKGMMSEALLLFCAFLFASRPINRVQVNLMAGNAGSKKVVEKCGFTYEGLMRKATWHNGIYHDLALYSLLREECPTLESLMNTAIS